MRTRTLNVIAALAISFGATAVYAQEKKLPAPPAPPVAAATAHVMVAAKDIKWIEAPPSVPKGAKIAVLEGDPSVAGLFTFRLKLPNNWAIPPHNHPADEHVTVIKGSFSMGMGDAVDKKAAKAMPVGSFMIMPKGSNHYAMAKGETIIQIHGMGPWGITYVNAADDPRNKPATPAAPAKK